MFFSRKSLRAPTSGTRETNLDLDALVSAHFSRFSEPEHINRTGLTVALRQLRGCASLLVETGTSAWGTDSSRLFAAYVGRFGGEFWTVDIRPEASERLGDLGSRTHFAVGDSVAFLESFAVPHPFHQIDLVYLDSFDLDSTDPGPSMEHGLREWVAIQRITGPGSVVIIDDTPIEPALLGDAGTNYFRTHGVIPGKGRLVLEDPQTYEDWEIVYHHYNVVLVRRLKTRSH